MNPEKAIAGFWVLWNLRPRGQNVCIQFPQDMIQASHENKELIEAQISRLCAVLTMLKCLRYVSTFINYILGLEVDVFLVKRIWLMWINKKFDLHVFSLKELTS